MEVFVDVKNSDKVDYFAVLKNFSGDEYEGTIISLCLFLGDHSINISFESPDKLKKFCEKHNFVYRDEREVIEND